MLWLFNNGFLKLPPSKKEVLINNLFSAIETPFYEKIDNEKEQEKQLLNVDTEGAVPNATVKMDLENYFFALSNLNFPELKLILDAIALHIRGESAGLKIVIDIFKERSKAISKIKPPKEAENIHNNNLLAVNAMVNILEEMLEKAGNPDELEKLIKNLELKIKETQQIIFQTNQEMLSLIAKYNLKITP